MNGRTISRTATCHLKSSALASTPGAGYIRRMSLARTWLVLTSLFAPVALAEGAPAPAPSLADQARAAVSDVVKLRGLPEKQPVSIEVDDAEKFLAAVRKRFGSQLGDTRAERALWRAFGLAYPKADPEAIA